MSQSPTAERSTERASYELGWVAIHRMLREGKSWSGRERHCAYLNTRDGRFADISGISGLDFADDARAAARVDWDLDGREDLWIVGRNSPRARLLLNRTEGAGRSLSVKLEGRRGPRDALGARVEVRVEGAPPSVHGVRAGEGYLSQSSRWLHIGLGAANGPVEVIVHWPKLAADRERPREVFSALEPGGRYRLVEGSGVSERVKLDPAPLATAPMPAQRASERARVVLTARPPLPPAPLLVPGVDEPSDLRDNTPRPLLVSVWASWCAPCIGELTELARRRDELSAAGLKLLALSADDVAARPAAIEVLERVQWEELAAFATPDTLDTLDALQRTLVDRRRRLPLPTSFLVDEQGAVAVIYRGPVDVDTLLADVARLRADPAQRRTAATPFAGRWIAPPPQQAALAALQEAYEERRLVRAAEDISMRRMELRKTSPAQVLNEMGMTLARQGRIAEATERFREATLAAPDSLDAHVNLAVALHEQALFAEAVQSYKRALSIDPRSSIALYNLGLARCALGDRASAEADLQALELIDAAAAAKLRRQMETRFGR